MNYLGYSCLIPFIIQFNSHLANKNSCYIILLKCLFADFCLIIISNVLQTISLNVQRIFMQTLYLCLTYLGTCLRYISNCGLGQGLNIVTDLKVHLGSKIIHFGYITYSVANQKIYIWRAHFGRFCVPEFYILGTYL